jgi:hypothetical protein
MCQFPQRTDPTISSSPLPLVVAVEHLQVTRALLLESGIHRVVGPP